MKKSSKILIYGMLLSILFIASCLYIEKVRYIQKQESLVEDNFMKEQELSIKSLLDRDDKKLEKDENLSYVPLPVDKSPEITIDDRVSKDKLDIVNNDDTPKVLKEKIIDDIVKQKNDNRDKIEIAQEDIIELLKSKKINFIRNRSRITKQSISTLNEIILILKRVPDAKIEVRGYTDASGKKSTNKWISEERAKSVKNYLGSAGINPMNIEAKGFGEEELLYEDKPYSRLNRRVEIEIKRR